MVHDLVVRAGEVLTPHGLRVASIGIGGERITAIGDDLVGRNTIDAHGLSILPGIIDGHTHMEAPAFGIRSRDTFESGPTAGLSVERESMVREYLEEMGWGLTDAVPSKETLERLGLSDIAADLESRRGSADL